MNHYDMPPECKCVYSVAYFEAVETMFMIYRVLEKG